MQGIRTYDYIMAMKEENQSMELDPFDDSDLSSDDSTDFDSPEKPRFVSRFICRGKGQSQVKVEQPLFHLFFFFLASSEAIECCNMPK